MPRTRLRTTVLATAVAALLGVAGPPTPAHAATGPLGPWVYQDSYTINSLGQG